MTQTADNPITSLRDRFRGDLVEPTDAAYDESRKVWNGAIDRRPRAMARCVDEADVQTAVRFATEHRLEIAVRGGAHSMSGAAVLDDGIVIDLSRMNQVRVDPGARRRSSPEGRCCPTSTRRPRLTVSRSRPGWSATPAWVA